MEKFLQLITENTLNYIFGIIGFVGSVVGIVSWFQSQKTTRIYEHLFTIAEKSLEKENTEVELELKQRDLKEVSNRVEELQRKIEREIPIEARRAVLKDRLYSQIEVLSQLYKSVNEINEELKRLGNPTTIPTDLLKAIENEVSPDYMLREKISELKTYLTIVTTTSAVASAILPFGKVISLPLLLFAIPILLRLLRYSLPQNTYDRNMIVEQMKWIGLSVIGIFSLVIGIYFCAIWKIWWGSVLVDESTLYLGIICILFSMICLTGSLLQFRKYKSARILESSQDIVANNSLHTDA